MGRHFSSGFIAFDSRFIQFCILFGITLLLYIIFFTAEVNIRLLEAYDVVKSKGSWEEVDKN